jgi:hypothetical protein
VSAFRLSSSVEPPDGHRADELPLYADLANPSTFRAEVQLWHAARPCIAELEKLVNGDPETRRLLERAPYSASFLTRAIRQLVQVPDPELWVACPRCNGHGKKKDLLENECTTCAGAGYQFR